MKHLSRNSRRRGRRARSRGREPAPHRRVEELLGFRERLPRLGRQVSGRLPQKLKDATKAAAIDQVNADLKAGRVTKAQADELKARINSGQVPFGAPGLGFRGGQGSAPAASTGAQVRSPRDGDRRLPRLDRLGASAEARKRTVACRYRKGPGQVRRRAQGHHGRRREEGARSGREGRDAHPGWADEMLNRLKSMSTRS